MPEILEDEVFRDKELKWNGWGYRDACFYYDPESKHIYFTGDKYGYEISGNVLPDLNNWMINRMGADEHTTFPAQNKVVLTRDPPELGARIRVDMEVPKPVRCQAFIDRLEALNIDYSLDEFRRLNRGKVWISTRASGMKRNQYGNIEDMLVHVVFVTPLGVMQKKCHVPRLSCGPDIHHFILGSEGIFGVVTEATFKIWPMPECRKFGSILFRSFENGVAFARQAAREHCAPAALRVVDNEQFAFGRCLKPGIKSRFAKFVDHLKDVYVTKLKGFNPDEMCVGTLVFEGSKDVVERQALKMNEMAKQFNALPVGSETGRYVYMLSFSLPYLRDMGFQFGMFGESFETSVPWDQVLNCCNRVRNLCYEKAKELGVKYPTFVSSRISQVYDSGACIYFYFGFNHRDLTDPIEISKKIESAARDEILACGGCISHHHGVGKLRKQWLPQTIGEVGLSTLRAVKNHLDPENIFGSGNLFTVSKM